MDYIDRLSSCILKDISKNTSYNNSRSIEELVFSNLYYEIKNRLSVKRWEHTCNVIKMGVYLANIYDVPKEDISLAALVHDMFKEDDIQVVNELVRKFKYPYKYINKVELSHSKIAAEFLKKIKIKEDIVNSVAYHTTARSSMSIIEKVMYVADAVSVDRKYPNVELFREKAKENIDEACMLILNHTIDYLEANKIDVDEDSLEALNYFLDKR